jgi:hypothetical protein
MLDFEEAENDLVRLIDRPSGTPLEMAESHGQISCALDFCFF